MIGDDGQIEDLSLESSRMLKQRGISATLWSGADVFLRYGLQFVVGIVLARLLVPEDFGTVAIVFLFAGIAQAFADGGFAAALIQRQDVDHTDESTVFWFNLGMGVLAGLALAALGPAIASLFDVSVLAPLTALTAVTVVVSSLGSIHRTLLTKALDFKTQMKIGGFATLVSGTVAIILAIAGYGVWALAWQAVVLSVVTTSLFWLLSSWRPLLTVSRESASRLFGFGGHIMAAALLDVAYTRAYALLIGKFFGVRDLGFYSRAHTTKELPIGVLTGVVSRVAFPIFSEAARDQDQLREGTRIALQGMMLLSLPMMLGLSAVAEPLVLALFGSTWLPSVPILRVLCLAAALWPLHVINLNVLMAQGHSNLFFRIEVIKKAIGITLTVSGAFFGVMGIAWSQVVVGAVAFYINAFYTRRHLDYGAAEQVRDFGPTLGIAGSMAGLVYLLSWLLDLPAAAELAVLVVVGAVFFVGVASLLGLRSMRVAIDLLRSRTGNRSADSA